MSVLKRKPSTRVTLRLWQTWFPTWRPSSASGIPDFRSPSGIWAEYDPMEYGTIAAFRRDPVKVWEFYALRFQMLSTAEPNAGHLALADLEHRGRRARGGPHSARQC